MIRVVTLQDAAALARLIRDVQALHARHVPWRFNAAVDFNAAREWLAEIIASPHTYGLVAEWEGVAAGYLLAQEIRREASIVRPPLHYFSLEHLAVAPAVQKRGLGTALMQAFFQEAAARKIDRVELDVWSFNETAQRFFARHGFAPLFQRMEATVPRD